MPLNKGKLHLFSMGALIIIIIIITFMNYSEVLYIAIKRNALFIQNSDQPLTHPILIRKVTWYVRSLLMFLGPFYHVLNSHVPAALLRDLSYFKEYKWSMADFYCMYFTV